MARAFCVLEDDSKASTKQCVYYDTGRKSDSHRAYFALRPFIYRLKLSSVDFTLREERGIGSDIWLAQISGKKEKSSDFA